MSKIKLSELKSVNLMPVEYIKNFMIENNYDTIINDYGNNVEYDITDLEEESMIPEINIWGYLKIIKAKHEFQRTIN